MKYLENKYEIFQGDPSYKSRKPIIYVKQNYSYMWRKPVIYVKQTRHICQRNPSYISSKL